MHWLRLAVFSSTYATMLCAGHADLPTRPGTNAPPPAAQQAKRPTVDLAPEDGNIQFGDTEIVYRDILGNTVMQNHVYKGRTIWSHEVPLREARDSALETTKETIEAIRELLKLHAKIKKLDNRFEAVKAIFATAFNDDLVKDIEKIKPAQAKAKNLLTRLENHGDVTVGLNGKEMKSVEAAKILRNLIPEAWRR